MLLDNKVAVITGIGPGLGRELAVQFAREGAAVAIGARTEAYLEEVRQEIDAAGGRVVAVPTDLADREDCERIVAAAAASTPWYRTRSRSRRSRSSKMPTSTRGNRRWT